MHIQIAELLLKTFTTDIMAVDGYDKIMLQVMKERKLLTQGFEEELMQTVFHPTRVMHYLEKYNYMIGIDEYNCL